MALPSRSNNIKFDEWYAKKVTTQTNFDKDVQSRVNGIKSDIRKVFDGATKHNSGYHARIWYKKPLKNNENNENSNENVNKKNENDDNSQQEEQILAFINNPSDRYWFSSKMTRRWVCKYDNFI